jgi:hypothetical protein
MPSYTTNLNLTKPTVGGDTNVWGGYVNGNSDTLDGIFADAGNGTSVGLNVGSGKTLTVAGTLTSSGSASFSNIDVNGGAIDNTPIGANTADTGDFTQVTATSAYFDTNALAVSGGKVGIGTTSVAYLYLHLFLAILLMFTLQGQKLLFELTPALIIQFLLVLIMLVVLLSKQAQPQPKDFQ